MKYLATIIFCWVMLQSQAQRTQKTQKITATARSGVNQGKVTIKTTGKSTNTSGDEARIMVPTNVLVFALSREIGQNLRIRLDWERSEIELKGQVTKFELGKMNVSKTGHDWEYKMQDVNSKTVKIYRPMTGNFSNIINKHGPNRILMLIEFETDGSEVKGTCPGCWVGEDNRAPDLDWGTPHLAIVLKPTLINGRLTVTVEDVETVGNFATGGSMYDGFMPGVLTVMQNKIGNTVKGRLKYLFTRDNVQNAISGAIKESFSSRGIDPIQYIGINTDGRIEIVGKKPVTKKKEPITIKIRSN